MGKFLKHFCKGMKKYRGSDESGFVIKIKYIKTKRRKNEEIETDQKDRKREKY